MTVDTCAERIETKVETHANTSMWEITGKLCTIQCQAKVHANGRKRIQPTSPELKTSKTYTPSERETNAHARGKTGREIEKRTCKHHHTHVYTPTNSLVQTLDSQCAGDLRQFWSRLCCPRQPAKPQSTRVGDPFQHPTLRRQGYRRNEFASNTQTHHAVRVQSQSFQGQHGVVRLNNHVTTLHLVGEDGIRLRTRQSTG